MATYYLKAVRKYLDTKDAADYLDVPEKFLYDDRDQIFPMVPYIQVTVYSEEVLDFVKDQLSQEFTLTDKA